MQEISFFPLLFLIFYAFPFQVSYNSENAIEGKRAAKKALQQRLGLKTSDLPLVGIISRLTHQKGIHLIKHAISRTLECNGQVLLHPFRDLLYEAHIESHTRSS